MGNAGAEVIAGRAAVTGAADAETLGAAAADDDGATDADAVADDDAAGAEAMNEPGSL